jgi:hypothetical protein
MFRSRDHVRRAFEDQFEPDGDGFLYRKSMRGAPVRVSAAEREAFVAAFVRARRRLTWEMFGETLLLMLGFASLSVATGRDLPEGLFYAGMGALIALWFVLWLRNQSAPARALERRAPVGRDRSRAEMRRLAAERMGWGTIAASGLLLPLLAFGWASDARPGSFEHWLWLAAVPLSAGGAALIARRKWQAGRGG